MAAEKKNYVEPRVTVYGDVEEITQNGHQVNADVPAGNNNTAFSPGP
jgi:hypothetical protein